MPGKELWLIIFLLHSHGTEEWEDNNLLPADASGTFNPLHFLLCYSDSQSSTLESAQVNKQTDAKSFKFLFFVYFHDREKNI